MSLLELFLLDPSEAEVLSPTELGVTTPTRPRPVEFAQPVLLESKNRSSSFSLIPDRFNI